jgi:putative ABC transport system permease protein
VTAELALALILLSGAGLMLKSLWVMRSGAAEYAPDRVLTARIQLLPPDYSPRPNRIRFWGDAAAQLGSIPGVRSAAIFASGGGVVSVSGVPRPPRENAIIGQYFNVTPEFLPASGMRVVAGRWIGEPDHRDGAAPVVVVSEAFVRQYAAKYPTPASILDQLVPAGRPSPFEAAAIVGVVSGFRLRPDADLGPQVFWPYTVSPSAPYEGTLLARASQDPGAIADGVRRVFSRYPRLNLMGMQTLADQLSGSVAPRRFQAMLLIAFAGLAVMLAMVGTHGVLSFAVTEQTRDIGVRMALGASRPDVLRMILSRGLRLAAAGAVIGLAGSLAITRLMRSMLYGVEPTDPWTLSIAGALLITVAILAAYLPARRAVRVDPIQALRYE